MIEARIQVRNTSQRDAEELVQVYVTSRCAQVPMPLRQLVGFRRVLIKAGTTETVNLSISTDNFRRWDETQKSYTVDQGEYELACGGASDRLPKNAILRIIP